MTNSPIQSILDELPDSHRVALTRESIRSGRSVGAILKDAVLDVAERLVEKEGDPDPTANCDLRSKKVVRAKDRQPGKGRAA